MVKSVIAPEISLKIQGQTRLRRQVAVNQYCEFRVELCEVEDALIEMYNAIQDRS